MRTVLILFISVISASTATADNIRELCKEGDLKARSAKTLEGQMARSLAEHTANSLAFNRKRMKNKHLAIAAEEQGFSDFDLLCMLARLPDPPLDLVESTTWAGIHERIGVAFRYEGLLESLSHGPNFEQATIVNDKKYVGAAVAEQSTFKAGDQVEVIGYWSTLLVGRTTVSILAGAVMVKPGTLDSIAKAYRLTKQ